MKNRKFNQLILSMIVLGISLGSCSKDEDNSNDGPSNNADVSAKVDEYPRSGDLVATAESDLEGELTFTLSRVSVDDAFIMDSSTGELRAANPFAFDYETNTEITGEITVSNGTETVGLSLQVDINNIDDIAYFLRESKAAYQAASPGDWVPITSSEYLTLSIEIGETVKSGTTDEQYEAGVFVEVFDVYFDSTVANDGPEIPENNYVYAFKYWSDSNNASGNKVKISTQSLTDGYEDLGNVLPTSGVGEQNFVLKGNDALTNGIGYLGMYSQVGLSYDVRANAVGTHYFVEGDTGTIGNNFNIVQRVCLYQGLSTPIKQWD
ncbi:hypothetical protein [uncultured Croceitalea sp.]|uniref:hypothetical protein n=1 Tax=uncultured Croceitalea sp. TaxID=1798908 RepID=UPI003305C0B3